MLDLKTIIEILDEEDAEGERNVRALQDESEFEARGYKFEFEDSTGGYEGGGEEHWIVFSVSNGKQKSYFQIPGWYASHYGTEIEIENTFEVEAGEKVIRVWNKKKKKK